MLAGGKFDLAHTITRLAFVLAYEMVYLTR